MSKVKILVFEYITGGGLAQEELPESLAREGKLMLQTLAQELTALSCFQISILLDWRCMQFELSDNIEIIPVKKNQCIYDLLPALIDRSDYVWPIAPEMDNVLYKISTLVEERKNVQLLNSTSAAVAICSNKLSTFQTLKQHGVAVVETYQFSNNSQEFSGLCVIKPKDGAGCLNSFLITNKHEFQQICQKIEDKSNYVIQPYLKGDTLSLSCLFKDGNAWLLCCNQQQVLVRQGQFVLHACLVNIASEIKQSYQQLINQVADIIPGLWGYVGIDIILNPYNQAIILEINPRLTTSYTGIYQSLGINVAKAVINLLVKDAEFFINKNDQVTITI